MVNAATSNTPFDPFYGIRHSASRRLGASQGYHGCMAHSPPPNATSKSPSSGNAPSSTSSTHDSSCTCHKEQTNTSLGTSHEIQSAYQSYGSKLGKTPTPHSWTSSMKQHLSSAHQSLDTTVMNRPTVFLDSQTRRGIPTPIKTPPFSGTISVSNREGENDPVLRGPECFNQSHQQRSYQPTLIVNEGVFVAPPKEHNEGKKKKSDFQKVKAALTPKRKFFENYEDDGAIRRAETQQLKAKGRQNAFIHSRNDNSATPMSSPRAWKGKWDQLKDTVKQLSPKLSPKLVATINDPFASMKRAHQKKNNWQAKAANEAAQAHIDAAAWGNPRSEPEADEAWLKRRKRQLEVKSKISAPINVEKIFHADRFGSEPLQNSTSPSSQVSGEAHRQAAYQVGETHGFRDTRITRLGDFIDVGNASNPRLGSGMKNILPPGPIRRASATASSMHRQAKSGESDLEYKCVGIQGAFAVSEGMDENCLFCGQPGAMQEVGLCHGCQAGRSERQFRHAMQIKFPHLEAAEKPCSGFPKLGEHSTRASSYIRAGSPFSDPGNPFDQESPPTKATKTSDVHTSTRTISARDTSFYGFYDDIFSSSPNTP